MWWVGGGGGEGREVGGVGGGGGVGLVCLLAESEDGVSALTLKVFLSPVCEGQG